MSAEETLMQIVESAGYLLKVLEADQPIAEREVKLLQTALDFVVASNSELSRTKKAQQCRKIIERLTMYTMASPHSATGDTDDVVAVGFDRNGAPTQKAAKYIEKTMDLMERSGKKKGGDKAKAHPPPPSASEGKEGKTASPTGSVSTTVASAATPQTPPPSNSFLSPASLEKKTKRRKQKSLKLMSPDSLGPQRHPPLEGMSPLNSDDEAEGVDAEHTGMPSLYDDDFAEKVDAHAKKSREERSKKKNKKFESDGEELERFRGGLAEAAEHISRGIEKQPGGKGGKSSKSASFALAPSTSEAKKNKKGAIPNLLEPILKTVTKKTINVDTNTHNQSNSQKSAKKQKAMASPKSAKKTDHSNVRWNWLNIPIERRLQTLAVSSLTFFTGLPFCVFFFVLLCCFKYTFPLMMIYLVYIFIIFPKANPHPIKGYTWWRRSWIFRKFRDYFPIRLIVPKRIRKLFDPDGNYFFIYHPHGIHSFGAVVCFGADVHGINEMLPGITFHVQTLGAQFWAPFWREMVALAGSGDASAKCLKATLNGGKGQCPVLVVGGAEESLLSSPKTNVLCLMKRKGFVRIALETGKPLVPVFAFGETNVYYNFSHHIPRLRNFLLKMQKKIKFALPLIVGRGYFNYSFGILPHRRPINVVIGEPLVVPHIPKPTREEIDFWHARYVEALIAHYEMHKGVYDPEGSLIIE